MNFPAAAWYQVDIILRMDLLMKTVRFGEFNPSGIKTNKESKRLSFNTPTQQACFFFLKRTTSSLKEYCPIFQSLSLNSNTIHGIFESLSCFKYRTVRGCLHIPIQTGQRFQSKPGSDSNLNRAAIPIQTGHLSREFYNDLEWPF